MDKHHASGTTICCGILTLVFSFLYMIHFFFPLHTVSAPIISGMHTVGGAVTGKPGSARLEETPAMDLGLEDTYTHM